MRQAKYHCGRHFDIGDLLEVLKKAQERVTVALISGKITLVYDIVIQGHAVAQVKLASTIEGHLGNRHRRGGQSAPRFQRLNDEARVAYLKKIQAAVKDKKDVLFVGTEDWASHFALTKSQTFTTRAWHESDAKTLARQIALHKTCAPPDHTAEAQEMLLGEREKVYGIAAVQEMLKEYAVEVVYAKAELLDRFPGAKVMTLDLDVFGVLWPGLVVESECE